MLNKKTSHTKQPFSIRLLKIGSLLLLSSSFLAPISADLLFTEDFETNFTQPISVEKPSGRYTHPSLAPAGNAPKIVTSKNGVTPRAGSHMMEVYLSQTSPINYRTSAKVHEYQNFKTEFEKGKAYWVGISVFIPADWSMDYGGYNRESGKLKPNLAESIILDFHDRSYKDKSWRRGLSLYVRMTEQGFLIANRANGCDAKTVGCKPGKTIQTFNKPNIPIKRGEWNDFVFHIKWSPNSDGFLRAWVNGEEKLNESGRNYYDEHTKYPYFKFGLYQSSWKYPDYIHNTTERTLYHDELRIGGAQSSFEEVAPKGGNDPTSGSTCNSTFSLPDNQWRQISLPCDPGSNNTVAAIFGDDITGTYGQDWVVHRHGADGYVTLDETTDTLSQGVGYWIIQKSGNSATLDMPDISAPTPTSNPAGCLATSEGCYELPLTAQWNMIGYPFANPVSLENTRVQTSTGDCTSGCDLGTAESQNLVHNQLWSFNGTDYATVNTSDNLSPWTAYWATTLDQADGTNPKLLLIPMP